MKAIGVLLLLNLVILHAISCEVEPNNSIADANFIDLNSSITGAINPGNDVDVFRFELLQAGTFQLEVTNAPAAINLRVNLLDSSGRIILTKNASGLGEGISFDEILCAGAYNIELKNRPFNNGQSEESYTLAIGLAVNDIYECNDTPQTASFIAIDSIKASLGDRNDKDYYSFIAPQSGTLQVRLTAVPSNVWATLILYGPNGTSLVTREGDSGESLSIDHIICEKDSTYQILVRVRNFTSGYSQDLYNLSLNLVTNDVYECNDTPETANLIALDSIEASLGDRNDKDYYAFIAPQTGTVQLRLTKVPSNVWATLILYGPDGTSLVTREGDNGESLSIDHIICEKDSTYQILVRVRNFTSGYSQGLYNLSVDVVTNDIYECNDTPETAAQVEIDSLMASLGDRNDKDYYEFTVEQTGLHQIRLTDVPSNVSATLILYDPNGTSLVVREGDSGESLSIDELLCQQNASYQILVRVRQFTSGFSQNLYTLTLNTKIRPPGYQAEACPEFDEVFTGTEEQIEAPGATAREDYHYYRIDRKVCETGIDANCTGTNAWNFLKSKADHVAPRQGDFLFAFRFIPLLAAKNRFGLILADFINPEENLDSPVQQCGSVELFGFYSLAKRLGYITGLDQLIHFESELPELLTGNPIAWYIDDANRCITNYTLPGHALHPGKVTRCIQEECGEIKVVTYGEGLHYLGDNALGLAMGGVNELMGQYLFWGVNNRFVNGFNDLEEPLEPPLVNPNTNNDLENKTWVVGDLEIVLEDGQSFKVFERDDPALNFWDMQAISFTLNPNQSYHGIDILGNTVSGTWWTDGDSLAIGYESNFITQQSQNELYLNGEIPTVVNGEVSLTDFSMRLVTANPSNTSQGPNAGISAHIQPNPAERLIKLRYTLKETTDLQINLRSSTGQLLRTIANKPHHSSGTFNLDLDISNLKTGVYFLAFQTGKGQMVKRLLIF